jgi:hypothetical protein
MILAPPWPKKCLWVTSIAALITGLGCISQGLQASANVKTGGDSLLESN